MTLHIQYRQPDYTMHTGNTNYGKNKITEFLKENCIWGILKINPVQKNKISNKKKQDEYNKI